MVARQSDKCRPIFRFSPILYGKNIWDWRLARLVTRTVRGCLATPDVPHQQISTGHPQNKRVCLQAATYKALLTGPCLRLPSAPPPFVRVGSREPRRTAGLVIPIVIRASRDNSSMRGRVPACLAWALLPVVCNAQENWYASLGAKSGLPALSYEFHTVKPLSATTGSYSSLMSERHPHTPSYPRTAGVREASACTGTVHPPYTCSFLSGRSTLHSIPRPRHSGWMGSARVSTNVRPGRLIMTRIPPPHVCDLGCDGSQYRDSSGHARDLTGG
jgi:hypothetical protein